MSGTPRRGTRTRSTRAPKHARRMPFAVVITALVLGGLALLLAFNTAAAANELRRHSFAARDQAIAARVEQLRNEIAASAAPGNLASVARALGMVPAENPAFIVPAGGRLIVRGKPVRVPVPIAPVAVHRTSTTPTSTAPAPTTSPVKTAAPTTSPVKTAAPTTSPVKTPRASKSLTATTTSAAPSPPPSTPTPTVTLPGGPR